MLPLPSLPPGQTPPPPFRLVRNLPGEPGVWQTVGLIRRLIRFQAARPDVRAAAFRATEGAGPYDHDGRLSRLREWIRNHVEYVPDPYRIESLETPELHVRRILETGGTFGDCDDAAALAGALAGAVGRPSRLRVASFRPDGRLHHIWTEARGRALWHDLDPFRSERFAGRATRLYTVGA